MHYPDVKSTVSRRRGPCASVFRGAHGPFYARILCCLVEIIAGLRAPTFRPPAGPKLQPQPLDSEWALML